MRYIIVSSTVTQHGSFCLRGAWEKPAASHWAVRQRGLTPERGFHQLELCITKYAIYLCSCFVSGKANISTPLYLRFVLRKPLRNTQHRVKLLQLFGTSHASALSRRRGKLQRGQLCALTLCRYVAGCRSGRQPGRQGMLEPCPIIPLSRAGSSGGYWKSIGLLYRFCTMDHFRFWLGRLICVFVSLMSDFCRRCRSLLSLSSYFSSFSHL